MTLLEKGPRLAFGCSAGSAGLIHPSHSAPLANPRALRQGLARALRPDSPFYLKPRPPVVPWLLRFAAASTPARARAGTAVIRTLSETSLEMHAALADAGLDTGFERRGVLNVYETEAGFDAGREEARASDQPRLRAEVVEGRSLRELEPTLSAVVKGGVYYPDEAHCDPTKFVESVSRAAEQRGTDVRTHVEVLRLRKRDRRVNAVETTAGEFAVGTNRARGGCLDP